MPDKEQLIKQVEEVLERRPVGDEITNCATRISRGAILFNSTKLLF